MKRLLLCVLLSCSAEPLPTAVPKPSDSIPIHATSALASASSAAPSDVPPTSSTTVLQDGPLPEPFPCPVPTGPVTKVVDLTKSVAMVADATGFYWSDGRALHHTTLDGATTKSLSKAIVPAGVVSGMTLRGDELLVWSADPSPSFACRGAVVLFSKSTGKVTTVHQGACVWAAAANDTRVAFTTRVSSGQGWFTGRLSVWDREKRKTEVLWDQTSEFGGVELDGERVLSIFPGQIYELTSNSKNAPQSRTPNFTSFSDFRAGDERLVARAGDTLYWVATGSSSGQKLYALSLQKDTMTVLGAEAEPSSPYGLNAVGTPAITARYVYWASPLHHQIRRADRNGKCGVEIVAKDRTSPDWVSVVGDDVYWLEGAPAPAVFRRSTR